MRDFPYNDDRLTLFKIVTTSGFVDTLGALADVADTLAGHPPGLPAEPEPVLPFEVQDDARDLAKRLRELAKHTRKNSLLP
jgi:hypothetical protein